MIYKELGITKDISESETHLLTPINHFALRHRSTSCFRHGSRSKTREFLVFIFKFSAHLAKQHICAWRYFKHFTAACGAIIDITVTLISVYHIHTITIM